MAQGSFVELDVQLGGASAQFLELAECFDHLLELINAEPADTVLDAVAQVAVGKISGADCASITLLTGDRFRTVAATDPLARQVDQLQYDAQAGPCVHAARERTIVHIEDAQQATEWQESVRRASHEWGIGSVLSYRLLFEEADGTKGSLNLYSRRPAAFEEQEFVLGALIATASALAVTAARHRDNAVNLARGLESSRDIGTAIGILMYAHKVTREQAFDLLRIASQHQHRKLRDIAVEVADTGSLELPTSPRRVKHRAPDQLR